MLFWGVRSNDMSIFDANRVKHETALTAHSWFGIISFAGNTISWSVINTAISSITIFQINVSFLSPSWSPRVSDDPIFLTIIILLPSDDLNTMINVSSFTTGVFSATVINTTLIVRPWLSSNSNGQWTTVHKSFCESVKIIGFDLFISRDGYSNGHVIIEVAMVSESFVGVVFLSGPSSGGRDVVISDFGGSTFASTGASTLVGVGSAIDKLLWGQVNQSTVINSSGRLGGLSSCKSPATTTRSLILNSRNGVFLSPVPSFWYIF